MKKYLILLLVLLKISPIFAQQLSEKTQIVFDACFKLRTAIASGNTTGLRSANKILKECDVLPFSSLRSIDESPLSLYGHFVFNEDFVDSLIAGRDVYKFAQRYASPSGVRGTSSNGKVYMKTCAVKGNASSKYSFKCRGPLQELAVVTEPGGLVTLRVHDKTNNKWYNDTKKVKKGMESRIVTFELPTETRCVVELEVINCGKKDCSFVVISN